MVTCIVFANYSATANNFATISSYIISTLHTSVLSPSSEWVFHDLSDIEWPSLNLLIFDQRISDFYSLCENLVNNALSQDDVKSQIEECLMATRICKAKCIGK